MKKALIGTAAAVVVIAGVVVALDQLKVLSDEPPIRVRNGSIEVHAGVEDQQPWHWTAEDDGDDDENDPSFSHEPNHIHPELLDKDLYVKVVPGTGAQCNPAVGSGRQILIDYGSGPPARVRRSRSGIVNQRTKVRPKDAFTLDATGAVLMSSGAGFVKRVRVGAVDCSFTTKEGLDTIYICMSVSDGACK